MAWTAKEMGDQSGRVVLITGANSGVGYWSAVAFAQKGARVVMACRSMEKAGEARLALLKAAPGASAEVMSLDLGSLQSVRGFATDFASRYDRLDVLMNNAGVMVPPYGKTQDGFETQFGTNHLGHFTLTGLLLDHIVKTPGGRVVTVSSGAYLSGHINFNDLQSERGYIAWLAYGQSKLANILFSQELHRRFQANGAGAISVACHPGYATTNLQRHRYSDPLLLMATIFEPIIAHSARVGANYQLYAATGPSVRGGEFYGPRFGLRGGLMRLGLIPSGTDEASAARLWQVSEQLTSVAYTRLPAVPAGEIQA